MAIFSPPATARSGVEYARSCQTCRLLQPARLVRQGPQKICPKKFIEECEIRWTSPRCLRLTRTGNRISGNFHWTSYKRNAPCNREPRISKWELRLPFSAAFRALDFDVELDWDLFGWEALAVVAGLEAEVTADAEGSVGHGRRGTDGGADAEFAGVNAE